MARVSGRELLTYILSRVGCVHPFRLSRLALLAELEWMRERGERLSDLVYVAGPGTFYVEGLKEMVEGDECFERREGDPARGVPGCIAYRCSPPSLPEDVKVLVDRVLGEASGLDDQALNERVLSHPLYERVVVKR